MKLTFGFGKRFGAQRLTPEQRGAVDRFERGALTASELEELLGRGARARSYALRLGDEQAQEGRAEPKAGPAPSAEADEERRARELVERIARDVDEETRR